MTFQPSNFYISIVDLFAVLLPGSCGLIFTIYQLHINNHEMISIEQILNKYEFIIGFLFLLVSYFIGHIIHQIGSLVDDLIYDPYKDLFYPKKKRLDKVKEIRERVYKHDIRKSNLKSTFEWSMLKIQSDETAVYNDVEKAMAESKFFRGLFVVAFLIIVFQIVEKSSRADYFILWVVLVLIVVVAQLNTWILKVLEAYGSKASEDKDKNAEDNRNEKSAESTVCIEAATEKERNDKKKTLFKTILNKYGFDFKGKKQSDDTDYTKHNQRVDTKAAIWALILLIVLVISPILLVFTNKDSSIDSITFSALIICLFSIFRYFFKRRKSTETAYKYIIFSHCLNNNVVQTNTTKNNES